MPKKILVQLKPVAINAKLSRMLSNSRLMIGGIDGLHLRKQGESASWFVRVTINGKRCDVGLGSYSKISVAMANKLATKVHEDIAENIDPLAVKRERREAAQREAANQKTFRLCAEAYIAKNEADWKNDKHRQQWTNTLTTYVYPAIGNKIVGKISANDVEAILEPIWRTKTETMERVFDFAKSKGYREGDNPAALKGNMQERLGKASQTVKHHASLPYAELAPFMLDLRKREGMSARALEFAILCAARSGEIREATWREFDLHRRLWTIPADRMKAKREHVVPLSEPAMAILRGQRALPRLEGVTGPEYVFPAPKGGAFSDAVFQALFRRMGRRDLTQHGFRSTFREWAGEASGYPREVVEHALAHQLADKAEAAYQRGSLLPKRVCLMADWANFCAMMPTVGNVVSIGEAA